jgi:hypothetical protein
MRQVWKGLHDDKTWPCYAVASAGKGRWFWCLWQSRTFLYEGGRASAHGHAVNRDAAVRAALAAATDGRVPDELPANYTRWEQRRLSAERRAQRPARATNAAAVEYVYSHEWWYPEYTDVPPQWSTSRFRVLRKTRTSIFVPRDANSTGYYQDGDLVLADDSIRLDRRRLEAGEEVYHGRTHRFYTLSAEPPPRDVCRHCPEYLRRPLEILGLSWPCDGAAVRRAYRRLARERHPDAGGTQADFVALQTAYEAACGWFAAAC